MSSADSTVTAPGGAEAIREGLRGKYVCPFCGSVNDSEQGMCPRCTMENSAATRKATKTRIGPWYVLQTRNPAAPGMTWDTLLSFIRKGRVKPRSIVRGPTTHQLWRFAAQVKGLSREFGICYSCGSGIDTGASLCPTCNRLQEPPPNPDALLEASREGQSQAYATPPVTIDGSVLATSGPATMAGQVTPASLAVDPVNEGDFVIPALGDHSGTTSMPGAASGLANATITPGILTPGPIDPVPVAPPRSGAQGPRNPLPAAQPSGGRRPGPHNQQPQAPHPGSPFTAGPQSGPQPLQNQPAVGPQTGAGFTGLSGDASWAKIPTSSGRERPTPQRPANRPPPNGAPAFNPYADDDAPGRRNDPEGFLSAKDLAAAFNLGFVGEEDDVPVQRTVRQPPGGPTAAAAGRHQPAGLAQYPMPRRRSRFGVIKVLFILLLLAGAGYGVAIAIHPEFREQSLQWIRETFAVVMKKLDTEQSVDPQKQPAKPKSATPTQPANSRPVDPESPDRPSVVPPATTNPGTPGSTTPQDSMKAFSDAMDLEDTDPQAALEKYRKIKQSFPREQWPALLDPAIRRVEKRLGVQPG